MTQVQDIDVSISDLFLDRIIVVLFCSSRLFVGYLLKVCPKREEVTQAQDLVL